MLAFSHNIKTFIAKPALFSSLLLSSCAAMAGDWIIGAGMYDITGPAADRGMVGYGSSEQTTQGIFSRLWSRAFILGSQETGDLVVFVSADLQSITQGVHQGVLTKIAADANLSAYLNEKNVMLTAIHNHVGPGGYDHNVMLNLSALGYDEDNYNVIVDGIYQSIVSAFNNKTFGNITLAQGELTDASINRNPDAYQLNSDKDNYESDVNQTMTLLKLTKDDGSDVGMINWFPVHNVSSPQTYRYISSDNKGMASYLTEKDFGTQAPLNIGFVAAFANSDEGDVSPNVCGQEDGCMDTTKDNVLLSATKQYDKALSLYQSAAIPLTPEIDSRFQYIKMPEYDVNAQYTQSQTAQSLCHATVGWSFVAGATWDGPSGIEGVFEGMTQDNEGTEWEYNDTLLGNIFTGYPMFGLLEAFSDITLGDDTYSDCQYPKPTFVNSELFDGVDLYAETLPFQLFRLGELAIIGAPGEITTMSGRRLRADVLNELSTIGVKYVIIAGLANAYGGYITTNEEYELQHYEGAHTLFGPNSLAAYQQIFTTQAKAMADNKNLDEGDAPKSLENSQLITTIGVVYDDKRVWESFGDVETDVSSSYAIGDTVNVIFRSGHPQNNYRTMEAFFEVQQKIGDEWQTLYTENDPSTLFIWTRDTDVDCLACSYAQLQWTPDTDTPTGTYRIVHNGYWKSGWTGAIKAYTGTSSSFEVK